MASTINAKNTSTGVVITPDASGQLELQTADTTRMTITSAGNVGVGTTAPTNSRLDVAGGVQSQSASYPFFQLYNTGLGSNPYYRIAYDAANNLVFNNVNSTYTSSTEQMRLDSSGNLGIGTSSPSTKLQVNDAITIGVADKAVQWLNSGTALADIRADSSSNLIFRNTSSYTERMRIASDGTITSTLGGMQVISGTSVSASGTSVTFTGIPSWAKKITVMFSGVSTNGTSNYLIQLGSGSITTSGYAGCAANQNASVQSNFSAGFVVVLSPLATSVLSGSCIISNLTSNTWTESGTIAFTTVTAMNYSAGAVSLSGTLDRIRITTVNGTDSFDAGTINILYE